jgi:KUP system potassium uptake protein
VLKAVVGKHASEESLILGALSLIFWTLTIQTTLKYVVLTLRADNNGEGGIFSLYTLVRRRYPLLIFPAMLGGAALLADGIITPPISVSSAIEGLRILYPEIATVPIVVLILAMLFAIQRFGTRTVGRSFGPIMVLWFSVLASAGAVAILGNLSVLAAVSPLYGYELLVNHPEGFWLLGAVFLCTTGAEALYSDLGHCGRGNITIGWGFVKTSLLLNYFGQGAWLLSHAGDSLKDRNPFYLIIPDWFLVPTICIATAAAVIASQALITGAFTVVSEAMRLYLFPKLKVLYPTSIRGQIYIPDANLLLFLGCVAIVLYFRESSNMEAAYGLSITLAMLVTTVLLGFYLSQQGVPLLLRILFLGVYVPIELSFLVANLAKFTHGGYVTLIIAAVLVSVMWLWNRASLLKRRYTEYVTLDDKLPILNDLSADTTVPKTATHLVYMTGAPHPQVIETKILYSLLRKNPKRADTYWFVHVNVLDQPFACEYEVTTLIDRKVFRIDFNLGFRVEPKINMLFRRAVEDLSASNEVDIKSNYDSLRKHGLSGDFRFVVLEKSLSEDNDLPAIDRLVMDTYFILKRFSLSEGESFGLDTSSVTVEKVPLLIAPIKQVALKRIFPDDVERGTSASAPAP